MLNFIYELKDFKGLLKLANTSRYGWASKASKLKNSLRRMGKEGKPLTAFWKTISGGTKVLADVWLMNSFELQPLIKDMTNIIKQIGATADAAQEEFSKRGLEPQNTHYTEILAENFNGSYGTGNNQMWFTGSYSKSTFNATMQYRYGTTLRQGWDLFRRYWGLNLTAGVIWEAIPFSFLADYFLKIGNAVHMMDLDPNVQLTVLQYCESIKAESHLGMGIDAGHSLVARCYAPMAFVSQKQKLDGLNAFTPINGVSQIYYRRGLTTPNKGVALPRIAGPSKGQQYNMLALIRGLMK